MGVVPMEAVPHTVIHAGEFLNQKVYGLFLVVLKYTTGMMMNRWMNMSESVLLIGTPRLRPISLISRRKRLGNMEWRRRWA